MKVKLYLSNPNNIGVLLGYDENDIFYLLSTKVSEVRMITLDTIGKNGWAYDATILRFGLYSSILIIETEIQLLGRWVPYSIIKEMHNES